MQRLRLLVLLLPLLALSVGCAFDGRWQRFAQNHPQNPAGDSLAGRWDGRWTSDDSGHSGRLCAIITQTDARTYRADFDATYLGIFRFAHATNLAATTRGPEGLILFEGQEDLGAMAGGIYRYKGNTDGRSFDSTYESKNDHGRFHMTRPDK